MFHIWLVSRCNFEFLSLLPASVRLFVQRSHFFGSHTRVAELVDFHNRSLENNGKV